MNHKKPFVMPAGPVAAFDVDDTLVCWNTPEDYIGEFVRVVCREKVSFCAVNKHNLDLLKKMSHRGHSIIVWSAGGSDWANAVVKALCIEHLVDVVSGKLSYWVDDISDADYVLGKYGYFDINGNRYGAQVALSEGKK